MAEQQKEFTLQDELVQLAEKRFNERHGKGALQGAFHELFNYFALYVHGEEQKTIAEVAAQFGVSRAYIYMTYAEYLEPLLGRGGHARRTVKSNRRKEQELFNLPGVSLAVAKARAHDLVVQSVFTHGTRIPGRQARGMLYVAGRLCQLAVLAGGYKHKAGVAQLYLHLVLAPERLARVDAVIVVSVVPRRRKRIFIIPQKVLWDAFFANGTQKPMTAYVPVYKKPVYNNNHPRIDYWQYEDAWGIFAKKNSPSL